MEPTPKLVLFAEMHNELRVVARWILNAVTERCDCIVFSDILMPSPDQIPLDQLKLFEVSIQQVLAKSFKNVWIVTNPKRYQAYRCIHVTPQFPVNEFLKRAANRAGIRYDLLGISDMTFTIWIEPGRVTTRYNDSDPAHVLYQQSAMSSEME